MRRNDLIPLCIGILSMLPIAGCVATYPVNYCGSPGTVSYTERPCAPCGSTAVSECGTTGCGGGCADEIACTPCITHGTINCHTCLSNIGNGVKLIGRGVLDAAAVPFIIAGKVLSSGCRYEVITDCSNSGLNFGGGLFEFGNCPGGGCSREVYYGDNYLQPQDLVDPCVPCGQPCSPCTSTGTTGCSSCAGRHTEGVEYSNRQQPPRAITVAPPVPYKGNGVIQASHQEPSAQVIRFVKPR